MTLSLTTERGDDITLLIPPLSSVRDLHLVWVHENRSKLYFNQDVPVTCSTDMKAILS